MRQRYTQPTLIGVNWGGTYEISRNWNHNGDSFMSFEAEDVIIGVFPMKYSFEAMINNSLGIISCLSGTIDKVDYLDKMSELSKGSSGLSDEGSCYRTATIWLNGSLNRDVYEGLFPTYQGDFSTKYVSGDQHFTLEHNQREFQKELPLDLEMILPIMELVSSPIAEINDEYFSVSRSIFGIVQDLQ